MVRIAAACASALALALTGATAAQAVTVTIASGPQGQTTATDATFTFSADEAARFTCSLDAMAATMCSSPVSYAGLALGGHTFAVHAVAAASGASADASRSWTIVAPPPVPDTAIVSGPAGATARRQATFTFQALPADGAGFECELDGAAPAPCASPLELSGLATGVHELRVRAVNQSGTDPTPADARWAVVPATLGAAGRAHTRKRKASLHGGFRFTPRMLLRTTHFPKPKLSRDSDDELIGRPYRSAVPRGAPRTQSPPSPTWTVQGSGNDPQIAVGKSFVVVTSYNQVWFFTKAGTPLTYNDHGQKIANPIPATTLFSDLWNTGAPNFTPKAQSINSFLNLPSGSKCNVDAPFPTGSQTSWSLSGPSAFCLNDFYDMRAVYDDFRDRFWIIAVARNPLWKRLSGTPANHVSRRTKVLLAVSVDGDPRDGFYEYWWNGVVDDGACTSLAKGASGDTKVCGSGQTYQPGDAADYPSIGISKDFFVQTIGAQHFNPFATPDFTKAGKSLKYAFVNVFQADKLAGGGCSSPCSWSYWDFTYPGSSSVVKGTLQAAVHHETNSQHLTYLAQNDGSDRVYVWGFTPDEGKLNPPLHTGWSSIATIGSATHDPTLPGGGTLSYANLGPMMLKAVVRGGALTGSFMDCAGATLVPLNPCATAARVVQLDPLLTLAAGPFEVACGICAPQPQLDVVVATNNPLDDPPGAVLEAGQPTADVSKNGAIVVGYIRCCGGKNPDARYAARLPGDATFRPDAVLKQGTGGGATGFNGDTGGAAADPVDPSGIWLAQLYGVSGSMGLQVGKVLGSPFADLSMEDVAITSGSFVPSHTIGLQIEVDDFGDAPTPASKVRLTLHCAGPVRPHAVTAALPAMQPGAKKTVSAQFKLTPWGKPPCAVRAKADPDSKVNEYNEANNSADAHKSATPPTPQRGGRTEPPRRRHRSA
jgi:CARDB